MIFGRDQFCSCHSAFCGHLVEQVYFELSRPIGKSGYCYAILS